MLWTAYFNAITQPRNSSTIYSHVVLFANEKNTCRNSYRSKIHTLCVHCHKLVSRQTDTSSAVAYLSLFVVRLIYSFIIGCCTEEKLVIPVGQMPKISVTGDTFSSLGDIYRHVTHCSSSLVLLFSIRHFRPKVPEKFQGRSGFRKHQRRFLHYGNRNSIYMYQLIVSILSIRNGKN